MVTLANKQDSNIVETSIALESNAIGVLPGSPVWYGLEPNSFDDFGGENTLLSRRFISSSRQRTKGSVVDLEATGSLEIDLTYSNHQEIFRGLMFADYRDKGRSPITAIAPNSITVVDGTQFSVGSIVKPLGLFEPANAGPFAVTAIAGNVLTVVGGAAESVTVVSILSEVGTTFALGDIDVDVSGALPALTSTTFDFTTLDLNVGEFVFVGGDAAGSAFANAENNGMKRVRSIATNRLAFDKSEETMTAEDGAAVTLQLFFGRFIHNEKGTLIKRFTYQMERKLGAPDLDAPNAIQAEYLVGLMWNTGNCTVETADKIVFELETIAMNSELRPASLGPKAGTRVEAPGEDPINTSTDVPIFHLAVVTPGVEAPAPLFAFVTDFSFEINNNLSINKAIGVLGGFDVTAGQFEVSAEMEAYFNDISAVNAVKQNSDVTLHTVLLTQNAGIVVDFPLLALGDGRLTVEIDEAIKIPLTGDAATAKRIDPALDYTMSVGFFDYLPNLARPAL